MRTTYARSYNTIATSDAVLDKVIFRNEEEASEFIRWLTKVLNEKGRVDIAAICDYVGIDISEEDRRYFSFLGFTKLKGISYNDWGSVGWVVYFPLWPEDFTQEDM